MNTTSPSAHWLQLIRSNIHSVYLLVLVCVTVLLGVALHPSLFPQVSSQHPAPQELLESGDFTMKEFWEARERHTTGSFQMNPDAITQRQTFRLIAAPGTEAPIFTFESDEIQSASYLVSTPSAQAIREQWAATATDSAVASSVAAATDSADADTGRAHDDIWIEQRDGVYTLQWLRSPEQMQEVVGFFDYVEEEQELLEDRVWYGVATVAAEDNRQ